MDTGVCTGVGAGSIDGMGMEQGMGVGLAPGLETEKERNIDY